MNNRPNRQGILIFNLSEEKESFEISVKAIELYCAWNELHNRIRSELKYHEPSEKEAEMLEKFRSWMLDIENEYQLTGIIC